MLITAREVVEKVLREIDCGEIANTVDTFKAGDPGAAVDGVGVTFTATLDVLKRAAEAGLNFVITHEPTFYHHLEDTTAIEGHAVLAAKRRLIADCGLVIWRCHDSWHRRRPDGIFEGVIDQLGWAEHRVGEGGEDGGPCVFELPPTTVGELAAAVKDAVGANCIRVVGDMEMVSGKVALSVGAPAAVAHKRMLGRDDVEVLVAGEGREWEAVEYVRDAASAGLRKALLLVGHCASEEAGMANFAAWLSELIPGVPVEHLPAGDPFTAV